MRSRVHCKQPCGVGRSCSCHSRTPEQPQFQIITRWSRRTRPNRSFDPDFRELRFNQRLLRLETICYIFHSAIFTEIPTTRHIYYSLGSFYNCFRILHISTNNRTLAAVVHFIFSYSTSRTVSAEIEAYLASWPPIFSSLHKRMTHAVMKFNTNFTPSSHLFQEVQIQFVSLNKLWRNLQILFC